MKKIFAVTLSVAIVLMLAACGGGQPASATPAPASAAGTQTPASDSPALSGGTFHYIFGHGAAEGSIGDRYCLEFKRLVEEKSGGKITVDVYSGSQLGTYGEMLQSLQTGDIGGMIFQPAPAVSFVPELAMLDLPYAFYGLTQQQIDKVLNNSAYSDVLIKSFEKSGYKFMSFAQAASFREVTSSKALRTVAEFKGLNLRTLENKYHIAFWKGVGANPTPVAFGELYLSLQQGLVNAQENPYDTALAAGFHEVQKYVVNTHHILYPNLFIVNKALFDSMPADYQSVFTQAADEARVFAADAMAKSSKDDLKNLLDAGMELIELPDSELKAMADKAGTVEDMLRADLGDDTVNAFFDALKK